MTDKEKIRKEVEKIAKSINPFLPDEDGKNSEYEAGRFAMVTQIMQIIDSLPSEEEHIDYKKLNTMLDDALSKETPETWNKMLGEEPTPHRPKVVEAKGTLKKMLDNIDEESVARTRKQMEEEVASEIDFEQELYKAFGQVRDFTLGMRIAKWFYDMGKNSQEPVSEGLEKIVEEIAEPTILNAYGTKELARRLRNTICGTPVSEDLEEASKEWLRPQLDKSYANYGEVKMMELTHFDGYAMLNAIEFGAEWQKAKDESTTENLGEYINELSKQFPEVSFAKLSRIAVRVAKWQKQQDQSVIELAEDHAMLAGMEKMKEEMMAKAIDAQCFGFQCGALFSFRLPASNYLVGSEVKVIVIKEN